MWLCCSSVCLFISQRRHHRLGAVWCGTGSAGVSDLPRTAWSFADLTSVSHSDPTPCFIGPSNGQPSLPPSSPPPFPLLLSTCAPQRVTNLDLTEGFSDSLSEASAGAARVPEANVEECCMVLTALRVLPENKAGKGLVSESLCQRENRWNTYDVCLFLSVCLCVRVCLSVYSMCACSCVHTSQYVPGQRRVGFLLPCVVVRVVISGRLD